jgi:putative membrane protein insertion efficiency factor
LAWVLVLPIRAYQLVISPLMPATCKFHPSCSAYAVTALRRHGPFKGLALASYRLGRCHPWQAGGLDPVPPRGAWRPDITPDGRTVIPEDDLRATTEALTA